MVKRKTRKKEASELCRACMSTYSQNKRRQKTVPVFNKLDGSFIASLITDCSGVQIEENDGLPATICDDCFKTVKLLDAFAKTVRSSDIKLRQLFKTEQTDSVPVESDKKDTVTESTTETHFLEVKCESPEKMTDAIGDEPTAVESDGVEPDNDTDSDWKAGNEEDKKTTRTAKRKKVGLTSKPTPRKRRVLPKRKPVQNDDDLKLNDKERELFKVIEIPPNSHTCCGCLQIYTCAEDLEAHRKTTHVWKNEHLMKPSSKQLCEGCLRRYDSTRSLNYHKERVRLLKVIWECTKCNYRFKVAGKRREHLKLHPDDEPVAMIVRVRETTKQQFGWVCCATKCNQSFATEEELIAHGKDSHWIIKQEADLERADKPEQCQICFQRFAEKKRIISHQRRKYKFKNFQCAQCGLKFTNSDTLTTHEAKEHSTQPIKCAICDKTFSQNKSMIRHVKIMHTDVKEHQCTVCGMTFRQKSGLKIHMSNHVEVPQYKCEVCSKMFKAKLHLRYHMRTHTGERPYKCQYCDSAFANHTNWKRHEMTHTGNKPHKCSYCEKSFILKRTLKEHETTHTGEQKYNCTICNKRFVQMSTLKHHINTAHATNDDNISEEEVVEEVAECNNSFPASIVIGNRPITIRPISVTVEQPQPAILIPHTNVQVASNVVTTAPNFVSPGETVATYNIVPVSAVSASGTYSYILKL